MGAGWADAAGERIPPGLECCVLQARGDGRLLDLTQSRGPEQLRQVALASAGEMRFIAHPGVELAGGVPERAERALASAVIPDTGGDDAVAPGHPRHLGQTGDRIRHEVDDELRQRCVERAVGERQLLRGCLDHVDAGLAGSSSGDERLRRIDGRHGFGTEPHDQLRRERARAAAHVEDGLPVVHLGEVRQLRGQLDGVPTHEAVVRVGGDIEAHPRNLPSSMAAGGPGSSCHTMGDMEGSAVSADGIPLSFEVRGAGEPTLVFIHGWSCDRGYWKHQVGEFGQRHQVVAIDLAGHGQSGDVGRDTWTMPAFAADVVAVADELRLGRMILIGHSMGGDAIVEAARRLPGRVEGLVWVDVYRTLRKLRSREELERFMAPFRTDFVSTTLAFVRGMFVPSSDPALVEWVAGDMAAARPDIALSGMEHAMTFLPEVIGGLRELGLPVVAINPDNEPTDVEALWRHGVKTVLMPGLGHFPFLEDPPAFNHRLEEAIQELTASTSGG